MGHTLLSLLLLTCLTICILPAASLPTNRLGDGFTFFATWGKGQYKLDLEVYHREVKPIFLAKFREAYAKTFNGMCGANPDFDIDGNGIVFPSAVRGQERCTRARFNLNLGQVVLDHRRLTEFNDFEDKEVSVFGTWGRGKYRMDIDFYHRNVKPKFISAFQKTCGENMFIAMCGKNPDFDIDKEGWVWPNAIKGKGCLKKDFILDLGDTIVLECQKNPNCLQLNGEVSTFETWGTGKYKLDMDVYHRDVKPIFLSRFRGEYGTKKFNDMCGTNPDFDVDKDGWVWPNAVKGKKLLKDLGDVIKDHQIQAIDGEGISDEPVISRLETVILQDLVLFILNRA